MKTKCCFMALGVGLSTPAFADADARPANAIERITIRDGSAKSEDPRIHCDSLRIDEKRARYFLRHWEHVHPLPEDGDDYCSTLPWAALSMAWKSLS